jgi:hydroxypyruvate isomerase
MIIPDVCIETLFPQLSCEEKIARTAACGYGAAEIWMPEGKDACALRQASESCGVSLCSMVVNAPNGSLGGAPVDAGDLSKYLERVEQVIEFGASAGITRGITCSGNVIPGLTGNEMRRNLSDALAGAAEIAARRDFVLLLEPLNTKVDHAGYFLDSSCVAAEIVREVGSPNLRLVWDIYHMQIMEGNVIAGIGANLDVIGHFHAAGVPGRHEITGGELNYSEIVRHIEAAGYSGTFGLEYIPAMEDHAESLKASLRCLAG